VFSVLVKRQQNLQNILQPILEDSLEDGRNRALLVLRKSIACAGGLSWSWSRSRNLNRIKLRHWKKQKWLTR
jgi:hypothetical protein